MRCYIQKTVGSHKILITVFLLIINVIVTIGYNNGPCSFNQKCTCSPGVLFCPGRGVTNLTIDSQGYSARTVYLDNNNLDDVDFLKKIDNITSLSIGYNKLYDEAELSDALKFHRDTMYFLDIDNNLFTSVPDMTVLPKLTKLYMRNMNISRITQDNSFPPSIMNMYIDGNKLNAVPEAINRMTTLDILYINNNNLSSVDGFEFPSSLRYLYLSDNQINTINSLQFTNDNNSLNTLDLHRNPLTSINKNAFENLTQLSDLDLSYTLLTRLPLALKSLSNRNMFWLKVSHVVGLTCTCVEGRYLIPWYTSLTSPMIFGQCDGVDVTYFFNKLAPECGKAAAWLT